MKLKFIALVLSVLPLAATASVMTMTCGTDFIQLFEENDYINEVRVNDVPTNIVIISHKVNKNGNVDSYLFYGFKGNRKVSQLHHSGDTGITTHRYFLFSQDGSPERPGKPISSPIVCK
ncbi:hypothetical protein M3E74_12725 [Morganella morganii]|uniref:hypothetical protein n=1 Tax=Morganella morganii TaxID=582 RepID=UPI0021A48FF1|nr:hypothetical protein [Morganella morganii]MCT1588317.1 hypothetical protein [Morganella morganii]